MRIFKLYFLFITLIGYQSVAATYTATGCPGPIDWNGLNGTCPFFNGGTRLSFEPAPNDVLTIPVGCTVTVTSSFSIFNNIKINIYGQLRFTGNEHLTMNGCNSVVEVYPGGSISGSSNSQQIKICGGNDWDGGYGTSYGPFTVTQNGNNLPIELLNFSGTCQGENVLLKWSTATEKNNAYFEIEKSYNGAEWIAVNKIPGNGTSGTTHHYTVSDKSLGAITYYRLKQVDYNGEFTIFRPVYTDCSATAKEEIVLYPNPSSAELNVTVNGTEISEEAAITIVNGIGQVVYEKSIGVVKGLNNFSLPLDLNPGSYYLFLRSEHIVTPGKKLVIIK
ncbi:MAG: putative aggregation factor core protein MAFp3 isoform [Bacteroidota bacterium]|jgi:hypothetical protein|nr:putative aggregation factor core protein MAFp3 isoform [Bacteroidota bacterium]